ncbi:hypothetical protein Cgig2_032267 [Carnegiea gigantea]|uniref:Uncharacterized protein n=1 Tax=Carnegiea gigantea TaxID=171969 RepID=A0A9Q1JV44_9CARY|nr:hypothetical protein Cgig2_032267 [Carnegiea gigantea]
MENRVKLPKFLGFRWHPFARENQRWSLTTDANWVSLASHWGEMKNNIVIPLYIIELPEASSLQKVVESLDMLNEAKQRGQEQGLIQNQPQAQDQGLTQNQPHAQIEAQNDSEPSFSEAGAWADNLIVSSPTEKVILRESSSKCQPKVTINRPNKLPISRPRPRAAKQPITPLQIDKGPYYTSTKSKNMRADLEGFYDFDVHLLWQSHIGEVNMFDSDAEENLGQADEDSDHDDSENSDLKEWKSDRSEESENLSLDEEDDLEAENKSLDDIDLKNDTQLHMTLGHGSIDDDVGQERSKELAKLPPHQQQHQGFQLSPTKLFKSDLMCFICFLFSFLFKLLILVVVLFLAIVTSSCNCYG